MPTAAETPQLSEPRWKVLDGLETCLRSVPGGTTNPWVGAADLWEASFGLGSDVVVLSGLLLFIRVLLGRPLGHFIFSLVGFKRILFTNIFQML